MPDRAPRTRPGKKRTAPRAQADRPGAAAPAAFTAPKGAPSKASPARLAALYVGRTAREREAFVHELISKHIDGAAMSPEDRAFATRLALGVASTRGTLDEVIDRALRSPDDVRPDVRDALRISAYEIFFLEKSPHAAVDQGVELVRSFAPQATRLANAALRKMVALKDGFPFGDPTRDLAALARLHAFPTWLARRLVADLGPAAARDFMAASNEPAPLFVAVNAARATDDEVAAAFAEAGERVAPVALEGRPVPGCLLVARPAALAQEAVADLLAQGKMLVSDAASQMIAHLALPARKPASFLEVGAGRATKTILLQSDAVRAYGSQMRLETIDNRAFKTKLLRERAAAFGIDVAAAHTGDARKLAEALPDRRFDAVFIDAPCSGLGTLRRHPEIRWRLSENAIGALADEGLAMLTSAAGCVAVGGQLTYATCTVAHDENNGVVTRFLESPAGAAFELLPTLGHGCFSTRLAPGSSDAHFAVRFRRRS